MDAFTNTLLIMSLVATGVAVFLNAVRGIAGSQFSPRPTLLGPVDDAVWQKAAVQLGLVCRPTPGGLPVIAGKLNGFDVKVERLERNGLASTRIEVACPSANSVSFERRQVPLAGWQQQSFPSPSAAVESSDRSEVRVNDAEFDEIVSARGPETTLLALMSKRARFALSELITKRRAEVREGTVRIEVPGMVDDSAEVKRLVHSALEVASSLGRLEGHARQALAPGGLLRALAENATHDPVPGVRKRNLRHLVERYPSSDETRRAAEGAEGDADPEMRLLAAVSLGGERASGVLLALARDSGVRSDLRVEAVERLRAARHPAVFEVARDVAPDADAALAQAAARALAELGDARAEPILIQLLGHESLEARSAAAEALGKLGTVRAVEPLLPLTKGLTTSAALKDAARAAVRAIQGRLGVVEAGRVSLTEEEAHAGALSIASEGGEVSLAPPEEVAAEPGAGRERTRGAGKGPG